MGASGAWCVRGYWWAVRGSARRLRRCAPVYGAERDLDNAATEVSEMRAKMRDNLGSKSHRGRHRGNAFEATAPFDLKQDAGGIVDIEFMVQYAALAWSRQPPANCLRCTDNIRILEEAGARSWLMPAEDARLLQDIYKAYRSAAHRQALQKQPGVVQWRTVCRGTAHGDAHLASAWAELKIRMSGTSGGRPMWYQTNMRSRQLCRWPIVMA